MFGSRVNHINSDMFSMVSLVILANLQLRVKKSSLLYFFNILYVHFIFLCNPEKVPLFRFSPS